MYSSARVLGPLFAFLFLVPVFGAAPGETLSDTGSTPQSGQPFVEPAPVPSQNLAPDVSVKPPEPDPAWGRPLGEMLIFNTGLWAYNRYYKGYSWARINPSSMISNIGSDWEWDADQFHINQFGHPYQGAMYYSSARYHGHDVYVSTAYTMVGSLQWEYFMETEKPSYNDVVTTTLGGAMLGEITYRLSNAMLDPHSSGIERVAREVGATAVNPVNGLNRLISGETFRTTTIRTHPRLNRDDLVLRLSSGGVLPGFNSANDEERTSRHTLPRANTEFLVMYGDQFNSTSPYDYFILNLGLNVVKQPVSTVSARAQIASWEIYSSGRQKGILLVGQNFDYLENGVYKLGVSGLGVGYAHIRKWGKNWFHSLHTEVGAIPLGGVSTEYFRVANRDYNLGGGAYSYSLLIFGQYDVWHTAFVSDRFWLRTRSGAKGDEFIGNFRWELAHQVVNALGVALSVGAYDRMAKTRDYGNRAEFTQETRLLLTYRFDAPSDK